MTEKNQKKHWVFRAHVADRAGALTSIASAFSNRGISLETVVGHGSAFSAARDGTVVATVWCTEDERDEIVRVLKRLTKVLSLEEHAYDSSALRKSAIVHVNRRLRPGDVTGQETFLTCEPMKVDGNAHTYFLAGSPSELDPVLKRLDAEGILEDVVYSVVGL